MGQISTVNTAKFLNYASIATNFHDKKEMMERRGKLNEKSLQELKTQTMQEFKKADVLNISLHGVPGQGYDENGNITIAGKLQGLDPNFNQNQINELKNFMLSASFEGLGEPVMNKESLSLLDRGDISIDEFKELWVKNQTGMKSALRAELQAQEKRADEKAEQIKQAKFKPIQATSKPQSNKDEATNEARKLFALIKREYELGKDSFEIFKKVAKIEIDKIA